MQQKTLMDTLNTYHQKNQQTSKATAARIGVSTNVIKKIERGQYVSPKVVHLLSTKVSDIFEPFVEYKTCTICGEKFAPHKKSSKTCSNDCSDKYHHRIQAEWHTQKRQEDSVTNTMNNTTNRQPVSHHVYQQKPKAEAFETLSRAAGMTYGQRQTLERLGKL